MNRLKDIFSTTMNQYYRDLYTQLLEAATDMRLHPPKFVKDTQSEKYVAEPFGDFYGDCETCVHYEPPTCSFVTGGNCMLDGSGCGYGFTCKNHQFTEGKLYEIEWLEEQLKKKDGDPL